MGSHRAERPSTRRRSSTPDASPRSTYVGRRVARPQPVAPAEPVARVEVAPPTVTELPAVTVELTAITESSGSLRPAVPGKRRAVKTSTKPKGPLRLLPSVPVVAGVATLAIAAAGAVTTSVGPDLVGNDAPRMAVPNAQTGAFGSGTYDALGRTILSRDSDRDALDDANDSDLVEEAAAQAEQRNDRLGELAEAAEAEAKEITLNRWVLPLGGYSLSAEFGQAGSYWSSGYHTGLDFSAPSGTSLVAIANGVVTFAGYDGAYGNKTVLTLEDGTEIWYCHQTSIGVSVGDNVVGGQPIGTVGSTGNTTGPHLHLEVRPGGGDPVDPYAALVAHGVTP